MTDTRKRALENPDDSERPTKKIKLEENTSDESKEQLETAKTAYQKEINSFNQIKILSLDDRREKARIYNERGKLCFRLKEWKEAYDDFKHAADLKNNIAQAQRTSVDNFNLGCYLSNLGNAAVQKGDSPQDIVEFYQESTKFFNIIKIPTGFGSCAISIENDRNIRSKSFSFFRAAEMSASFDAKKQIEFLENGINTLNQLCEKTEKDEENLKRFTLKLKDCRSAQQSPLRDNWFLNDKPTTSSGDSKSQGSQNDSEESKATPTNPSSSSSSSSNKKA